MKHSIRMSGRSFSRRWFVYEKTCYEKTSKLYFTVTYSKKKFKLKISDGRITEETMEKYLKKYSSAKTLILENVWLENYKKLCKFVEKKKIFLEDDDETRLKKIFYDLFL